MARKRPNNVTDLSRTTASDANPVGSPKFTDTMDRAVAEMLAPTVIRTDERGNWMKDESGYPLKRQLRDGEDPNVRAMSQEEVDELAAHPELWAHWWNFRKVRSNTKSNTLTAFEIAREALGLTEFSYRLSEYLDELHGEAHCAARIADDEWLEWLISRYVADHSITRLRNPAGMRTLAQAAAEVFELVEQTDDANSGDARRYLDQTPRSMPAASVEDTHAKTELEKQVDDDLIPTLINGLSTATDEDELEQLASQAVRHVSTCCQGEQITLDVANDYWQQIKKAAQAQLKAIRDEKEKAGREHTASLKMGEVAAADIAAMFAE